MTKLTESSPERSEEQSDEELIESARYNAGHVIESEIESDNTLRSTILVLADRLEARNAEVAELKRKYHRLQIRLMEQTATPLSDADMDVITGKRFDNE